MTTRVRKLDDNSREWSILDDAAHPDEGPYRLLVTAEEDGLIELADAQMTSASETAERLRGGDRRIWFTREQVRWLINVLPQALAYADREAPVCASCGGSMVPAAPVCRDCGRVA